MAGTLAEKLWESHLVRRADDEPGERGRPRLKGGEHQGGLVQDADSAAVVHMAILPSHEVGCKR